MAQELEVEALLRHTLSTHGRLDVFVNNAAQFVFGDSADLTEEGALCSLQLSSSLELILCHRYMENLCELAFPEPSYKRGLCCAWPWRSISMWQRSRIRMCIKRSHGSQNVTLLRFDTN